MTRFKDSNNLFNAFNFSQIPTNPIIIEDMDLEQFKIDRLNEKIDIFIVNIIYLTIFISIILLFSLSYIIKKIIQ